MTDTQQIVVKLKDEEEEMEKSDKVIEQVEKEQKTAENGKAKDEMTENEKEEENEENDENKEKKPLEKKDSAIDRFLEWWRGKPKNQENLNDEEAQNDEKEKGEKDAQTENDVAKETTEKEQEGDQLLADKKEIDSTKTIETEVPVDAKEEVKSEREKRSSPNERRLEKIVEEQKRPGDKAPLAQAEEEEEIESLDSRSAIDQPVTEPKNSEIVEAGKENFEVDSPPSEDVEDKSENRKSARVETFVVLDKPTAQKNAQTNEQEPVNIPSESDERRKEDTQREESSTQGVKKSSQQSGKMEHTIEEIRDDPRQESVKETWKQFEETPNKEGGSKTYRVSYTIRTTTIDKTKPAGDDDDDDERLFGKDVLLDSTPAPTRYEGPPPENVEDEIQEEHAREDHAANEDIDRFFEQCKEDGDVSVPIATQDEVESKPAEEIIPQTPDDIFRKLHSWDDEPTDWWTITKKKKEYEEWMKPMKDGTIRRVIIPHVEIPYETCVHFITDWKHREEWDKTFSEIQVLKSDKESKVIYSPVKKRDLTFETLDREETDPPCHLLSWSKQEVIRDSQTDTLTRKKQKPLQFITHTCGIILRPSSSGDQATKITILCQLEGKIDRVLKNTFLAGHPKSWLSNLKKYYKKQQKQDNQKVVYL